MQYMPAHRMYEQIETVSHTSESRAPACFRTLQSTIRGARVILPWPRKGLGPGWGLSNSFDLRFGTLRITRKQYDPSLLRIGCRD